MQLPSQTAKLSGLCLLLGLLCGAFFGRQSSRPASMSTLRVDHNKDGNPDAEYYYAYGVITKTQSDRNNDGRWDYWEQFENGEISKAQTDDDFDEKVDGWMTFEKGMLHHSQYDTDRNGPADVTYKYEQAVLAMAVWHPNDLSSITKVALYASGIVTKEYVDDDRDGVVDRVVHYDSFENVTSEEKPSTRHGFDRLPK